MAGEPKVAKNAVDMVSRINPKYHFPSDMKMLEREIRICLGLPVKGRMGGFVPYGYIYDEATDVYQPIPEVFDLLWQARRFLYTSTLREVTAWLNFKAAKIGVTKELSHMGLRNIMVIRPPFEEHSLPIEEREKMIESLCQWNHLKNLR